VVITVAAARDFLEPDLSAVPREGFFIPVGPCDRAIHHEPESFDLRRRPLIAEDYGDSRNTEPARSLQTQVPVDDLAVASNADRES